MKLQQKRCVNLRNSNTLLMQIAHHLKIIHFFYVKRLIFATEKYLTS